MQNVQDGSLLAREAVAHVGDRVVGVRLAPATRRASVSLRHPPIVLKSPAAPQREPRADGYPVCGHAGTARSD
jgi:hypothetical protein